MCIDFQENYDDSQSQGARRLGYRCFRMQYMGEEQPLTLGYGNFKRKNNGSEDYWYIEEFDTNIMQRYQRQGYGTRFLRFLIQQMYQEDHLIVHTIASTIKSPLFPQWLIERGFQIDDTIWPEKTNSLILLPCNATQFLDDNYHQSGHSE